jgi:hypothetical protein
MQKKKILNHDRIRKTPKQFSWIDGRLVRDGHLQRCTHSAAALYLFLLTVSDAYGLSYYGDKSVCKQLTMDNCQLAESRLLLIQLNLIAYRKPLYQVLDLAPVIQKRVISRNNASDPVSSLGQILNQIREVRP